MFSTCKHSPHDRLNKTFLVCGVTSWWRVAVTGHEITWPAADLLQVMLGQVEHDVAHMFHHHTRSLTTDRLTLANRNYDLGEFYLTLTEGLNLGNRNHYTVESFYELRKQKPLYFEIIFINWIFNFIYFAGRAIHESR